MHPHRHCVLSGRDGRRDSGDGFREGLAMSADKAKGNMTSTLSQPETKMNPELKAKWLAALRSGEYEQTHGQLRKGGIGFCCLGVLCDVSPEIEWQGDTAIFNPDSGPDTSMGDAELPVMFAKALGIYDRIESALVNMNDGNITKGIRRHTFAEIADWIEANL